VDNFKLDLVYLISYFGIMNTQKTNKLNQLISQWQRGTVYTQSYFSEMGYYHDLIKSYKRSGWLESIGTGAYVLPNDNVDLFGGLYALQHQLKMPVHLGGRTALELKGYGHYARFSNQQYFLFGAVGTRLPKWFEDNDWGVKLHFIATKLIMSDIQESFTEYEHKEFSVKISAPERAALEILYYIPSHQGFDEAMRIMEGLMTLRPKLVQNLLEDCHSVKVKRLFLYMSEKLDLPWFAEFTPAKIDLGSGKRVIIKDGVLNNKYLITVPREALI